MNNYKISQNNLVNSELVKELVSIANFQKDNTILEIGAGRGIITKELLKYSENVIAFEIDENLFKQLQEKFKDSNLTLSNMDFLDYELPENPFYTFSNIPFNKTAEIFQKLLSLDSQLVEGFLIVQQEAYERFAGEQAGTKNTLLSVIYGVNYTFEIQYLFKATDFYPIPNVKVLLINVRKRDIPLIPPKDQEDFFDFVSYLYNRSTPNIGKCGIITGKQMIRFEKELKISRQFKPSELKQEQLKKYFRL